MFTGKLGSPVPDSMKGGCLFLLAAIVLTILPGNNPFIALVAIVLMYLVFGFRSRVEVDITAQRFRKLFGTPPLMFGSWQALGTPEYLLLSDVHRTEGAWSLMGANNSTFKYRGIYLSSVEFEHMVLIHQEQNDDKAEQVARALGEQWGIEVREETD